MTPIDPSKCKHLSVSKFASSGISVAALRWQCNYCGKIVYQVPTGASIIPPQVLRPLT